MGVDLRSFNSAMNFIFSPVETVPFSASTINVAVNLNGSDPRINAAILDSTAGGINLAKIGLAFAEFAGKELPGYGTLFSVSSLGVNVIKAEGEISETGAISTSTALGMASDITAIAAGIALLGAGVVGSVPVAIAAGGLALLGAGLTIASVVTDGQGTVDLGSWNCLQDAVKGLHDGIGSAFQSMFENIDLALDGLGLLKDSIPDFSGIFDILLRNEIVVIDPLPDVDVDRLIDPNVNTTYLSARAFVRRDPLVLDLDGDGIETTAPVNGQAVLFDHDGDGLKTGTGWVKADDALLVIDKNGNGSIDSGAELFGVDTVLSDGTHAANGFAALADLDTNHDGVFDGSDAAYSQVRVWQDQNQDGISQSDELFSLAAKGIAAINLAAATKNQMLANGNQIAASGSYTRSDGTTGTAAALNLVENPFYREYGADANPFDGSFNDPVTLTAAATALPDLHGTAARCATYARRRVWMAVCAQESAP